MSMSVDDVLKADIPEGKFKEGLKELQLGLKRWTTPFYIDDDAGDEVFARMRDEKESYRASFEALLELANGNKLLVDTISVPPEKRSRIFLADSFYQEGRAHTLSEVRRVVEEIRIKYNGSFQRTPAFAAEIPYDILNGKLAELEAKG